MVRISDIVQGDDFTKGDKLKRGSHKNKEVSISEVVTAESLIGEKVSPNLRAPTKTEIDDAITIIKKLTDTLRQIFTSIKKGKGFDIAPLEPIAKDFVETLKKYDNIYMTQAYNDYDYTDLVYNSMWTGLFSTKVGRKMGMDDDELKNLAIAGFLHTIGSLLLDKEIRGKKGELSNSETEEIRSHPEKGYKLLEDIDKNYRFLMEVVYQEHEREDGSGYPLGLKGKEIDLFSKIIGLSDTYEAMTHDRPYRKRGLPLDVIKYIIEKMRGKFNSRILKLFLEEITLFPVGSFVKLNNKEIGRVIACMGGNHFRHVVQVLYDSDGEILDEPRTINLMEEHLLHISEPVDERTLGKD